MEKSIIIRSYSKYSKIINILIWISVISIIIWLYVTKLGIKQDLDNMTYKYDLEVKNFSDFIIEVDNERNLNKQLRDKTALEYDDLSMQLTYKKSELEKYQWLNNQNRKKRLEDEARLENLLEQKKINDAKIRGAKDIDNIFIHMLRQ